MFMSTAGALAICMRKRGVAMFVVLGLIFAPACRLGGSESAEEVAPQALEVGLGAHVQGRLDEAVKAYEKVLEHDSNNKYALYNLGLIQQTKRRPKSAEKFYRRALAVDPDYVPVLFNLAILRAGGGQVEEAINLYRRVIELDPQNAGAHLNLGFALRSVGKIEEGDAEVNRALELDPTLTQSTRPPESGSSPGSDYP